MRTVNVVAAIIIKEDKVLATQRGFGEFRDRWEFPGGKIEPGETASEALMREICEELRTDIRVGALFTEVEYDYPTFHLSMQCYLCELLSDDLELVVHQAAGWLDRDHLHSVNWLPADLEIVDMIEQILGSNE